MVDKFGIVIVTYRPDVSKLQDKINKYSNLTENIIIVNNGSSLNIETRNCQLINLKNNKGIAYAQNVGVSYLKKKGISYFFFLDQDSRPDEKFFRKMLNIWKNIERSDPKIGLLSPNIFDRNLNVELMINQLGSKNIERIRMNKEEITLLKNTLPISSGVLCKTEIFDEVNGNNSWMFIDWVDFQFDISLIKSGYHTYTTSTVCLNHTVGKGSKKSFLGKKINVSNHATFREYYYFRNGIVLYKTNKKNFPQLKSFIRHALITRIVFVLYENQKVTRMKSIIRGIKDGVKKQNNEI